MLIFFGSWMHGSLKPPGTLLFPLLHVPTPNCCWMKNGTKIPPAAARRTARAAPTPLRTAPAPLRTAPAPARLYLRGTLLEPYREVPRQESRFGGAPPVATCSRMKHMHPCVDREYEVLQIWDKKSCIHLPACRLLLLTKLYLCAIRKYFTRV